MLSLITPNQQKKQLNFGMRKLPQIPSEICSQTSDIMSAINSIKPKIQGLVASSQDVYGGKKALAEITKISGITPLENGAFRIKINNKTIEISLPDTFSLILRQLKGIDGEIEKEIKYSNRAITDAKGFDTEKDNIVSFIKETLAELDFPILKLRRSVVSKDFQTILDRIKPPASLNAKQISQIEEIKGLFEEIHSLIDTIKHPVAKTNIKYGYNKIIKKGKRPQEFEFLSTLSNEGTCSVNRLTDRQHNNFLVLKINNSVNNHPIYYFINENNQVLKEMNLSRVVKIGERNTYYTQNELELPTVNIHFTEILDNLKKYKTYLKTEIEKYRAKQLQYSTTEIGTIKPDWMKLINEVEELFKACKAKMLKIKDMPRKQAFKEKYGIDTIMSSPCLIFRKINDTCENIVLSFPVMKGKKCTKIIITGQNDNIKKSLFVEEDKLVKFQATSLGRSSRNDTVKNYHSQEEIENSGLANYLQIAKTRLEAIPKPKKK